MGIGDKFNKLLGLRKKEDTNLKPPTNDEKIENSIKGNNDSYEGNMNTDSEIEKPTHNNTFKYLDNLIHNIMHEIILDSDIYLDEGEESEYSDGIKLDVNDIRIDGNGHIIDAKGKARIFETSGKNIMLKNIILKNGFTESRGGAIFNRGHGELTITESLLHKNTANRNGGAIFNSGGGKLTITESSLSENTAKSHGGAIDNNGTLSITESTIDKNVANSHGGAIDNNGELTLTKAIFNENVANIDGGAINNNGELTITESSFKKNTAKEKSGGAINNNGDLRINESILNENVANSNGGAINNEWSKITIMSSLLNENTAYANGGAINNEEGNFKIFNSEISKNNSPNNIVYNNDLFMMDNTSFYENNSMHLIFNTDKKSNLSIFWGEFIDNNISETVILNKGKSCTIKKSIFEKKSYDSPVKNIINLTDLTLISPILKDPGQTIINEGIIVVRESSQGLFGKIDSEKGVINSEIVLPAEEKFDFGYLDKKIHESETKEIFLDQDISIENYERDFYEGGIELDIDDLVIDGNGHIIDGKNNSRIFIITGNNITLKNIIFRNGRSHRNHDNRMNNNGGAIKNTNYNRLTIENCKFLNNTSEEEGGAIHNKYGDLRIIASKFSENTAIERTGGAIYNGGRLTVTESQFDKNNVIGTAFFGGNGGAFYNEGELLITSSTIFENIANRNAGAIFNKGTLKIIESRLNANIAKEGFGGAINNGGILTIEKSMLIENVASRNGGAIKNMWNTLKITESIINENIANLHGGGISNSSNAKYELIQCTVENNQPDNIYEDEE